MSEPSRPISTDQKMDPELKAKWLKALRSGRYKQGRGALRDENNCYCCLGVLGDIFDPSKWSTYADNQVSGCDTAVYSYGTEVEMLRSEMLRGLGIEDGTILASMNDGEDGPPQDFLAIAEWIERNL